MIGSIVRQTRRISCPYLGSAFAIAVVIAFIWLSPAAAAGTNSANVTASPSAKYADSGNSSGSYNYGGMVVAGIIAVLTAVVGAAVWRAHEVAVQKNAAAQREEQTLDAPRGAGEYICQPLEQLQGKLETLDNLDICEDGPRTDEA